MAFIQKTQTVKTSAVMGWFYMSVGVGANEEEDRPAGPHTREEWSLTSAQLTAQVLRVLTWKGNVDDTGGAVLSCWRLTPSVDKQ